MTVSILSELRLHRLKSGLTQFVVARRARLSPARLSILERGHDEATPSERAALASALDVAETKLFPGVEDRGGSEAA